MPKKKTVDGKTEQDFLNLPKAVRDQAKAADALMSGDDPTNSDNQNTDGEYVNPNESFNNDPPTQEPKPASPQDTPPPVKTQDPTSSVDAEPAPQAAPAIPTDAEDVSYKHKYEVLQGKYNKEVGELKLKVNELTDLVNKQTKILETRSSVPQAQQIPEVDIDVGEPLKVEDFEDYGKEMVGFVNYANKLQQVIKDQATVIQSLQNKTPATAQQDESGLVSRLERIENETAQQRAINYTDFLDKNIGNEVGVWRKINYDPQFHEWLKQLDPMVMVPRGQILTDAANNLRAEQVASIFNQYLGSPNTGKVNPGKVSVADNLPAGSPPGEVNRDNSTPEMPNLDVLKKAEQDFLKGRIDETQYDSIVAKYQNALSKS